MFFKYLTTLEKKLWFHFSMVFHLFENFNH